MHDTQDQVGGGDRPKQKRHGFVQVVDRAGVEGEPALNHGDGMQSKGAEQDKIIHMVVPAKTASPEEQGIDRARPITGHGEQEEMPVGKPIHGDRLIRAGNREKAIQFGKRAIIFCRVAR